MKQRFVFFVAFSYMKLKKNLQTFNRVNEFFKFSYIIKSSNLIIVIHLSKFCSRKSRKSTVKWKVLKNTKICAKSPVPIQLDLLVVEIWLVQLFKD